jgi:hypothetical protein
MILLTSVWPPTSLWEMIWHNRLYFQSCKLYIHVYIVLRFKSKDDILDDLAATIILSRLFVSAAFDAACQLQSTAIFMPTILQKSCSQLDVIVKYELAFLRSSRICYFIAFQVCVRLYQLVAKVGLKIVLIIF